jgi:hypothetical protein
VREWHEGGRRSTAVRPKPTPMITLTNDEVMEGGEGPLLCCSGRWLIIRRLVREVSDQIRLVVYSVSDSRRQLTVGQSALAHVDEARAALFADS